jgi:hypothetical protein
MDASKFLSEQAALLQDDFAMIDLLTRPSSNHGMLEYLVKRHQLLAIRIDGDRNHGRAHVHVDYGRSHHAASYAIDSGERLAGALDSKYDKSMRTWIATNRKLLLATWNATQDGKDPRPFVLELDGTTF